MSFLRSWRPGNASKGFLEVIRFDSTEYEPVGRHGNPKRLHFHDFPDDPGPGSGTRPGAEDRDPDPSLSPGTRA